MTINDPTVVELGPTMQQGIPRILDKQRYCTLNELFAEAISTSSDQRIREALQNSAALTSFTTTALGDQIKQLIAGAGFLDANTAARFLDTRLTNETLKGLAHSLCDQATPLSGQLLTEILQGLQPGGNRDHALSLLAQSFSEFINLANSANGLENLRFAEKLAAIAELLGNDALLSITAAAQCAQLLGLARTIYIGSSTVRHLYFSVASVEAFHETNSDTSRSRTSFQLEFFDQPSLGLSVFIAAVVAGIELAMAEPTAEEKKRKKEIEELQNDLRTLGSRIEQIRARMAALLAQTASRTTKCEEVDLTLAHAELNSMKAAEIHTLGEVDADLVRLTLLNGRT